MGQGSISSSSRIRSQQRKDRIEATWVGRVSCVDRHPSRRPPTRSLPTPIDRVKGHLPRPLFSLIYIHEYLASHILVSCLSLRPFSSLSISASLPLRVSSHIPELGGLVRRGGDDVVRVRREHGIPHPAFVLPLDVMRRRWHVTGHGKPRHGRGGEARHMQSGGGDEHVHHKRKGVGEGAAILA